jgi:hypothetical protein
MTAWKLKRTVQCAKCPWRVEVDPRDIPNGYTEEQHRALKSTIAEPGALNLDVDLTIMACHETQSGHCIGWLSNQLGPGQNIAMRMRMRTCTNGAKIRLRGAQHATFEDTLPK